MTCVANHAAPTPTTSTAKSHDWKVGNGSDFCQQSKTKAAATDIVNCSHCMTGA